MKNLFRVILLAVALMIAGCQDFPTGPNQVVTPAPYTLYTNANHTIKIDVWTQGPEAIIMDASGKTIETDLIRIDSLYGPSHFYIFYPNSSLEQFALVVVPTKTPVTDSTKWNISYSTIKWWAPQVYDWSQVTNPINGIYTKQQE